MQRNGLGEWTAYTQQRNKICRACHPFLTLAENEAPKSPPSSSIIPKENPFFFRKIKISLIKPCCAKEKKKGH